MRLKNKVAIITFDSWDDIVLEIRKNLANSVPPYYQGSIESAFNLAFWDIQGKIVNKSVCQLFGFEPKEHIPVYGTGLFYRDVDNYKDQLPYFLKEAVGFVERGYKGIKMKAGKYQAKEDAWLIEQVKKELPKDMLLMVDANCGMKSTEETKLLISYLEEVGVTFLEEPFHPYAYDQYDDLTDSTTKLSIAGGENEFTIEGFQQLIQSGVTILQPELSLCGGFSHIPTLLKDAKESAIQLTPHVWGSGFLYASALQFYSMLGEEHRLPFECPFLLDPLRDHCFEPISIKNGYIDTPKGPGMGVEINEKECNKYIYKPSLSL